MTQLHLHITDYQSPHQWRWLLQDDRGSFLADHEVNLPQDRYYRGFLDIAKFLKNRPPDWSEEQVLAELGRWIGQHVLGDLRDALAQSIVPPAAPIHVHVPEAAQSLLFRPLELAQLPDGRSLVEAGLRFIYRLEGQTGSTPKQAPQQALRLLAVFSLPGTSNPLNLRRERYQLNQLVRHLNQTSSKAIELRILQYGATRATLQEALQEGAGWDVIHLSGHGLRGALLLEDAQGHKDEISTQELAQLLDIARARLKLLILDACYTGAASHAAARRAVGLDEPTREQATGNSEQATVNEEKATVVTELPSLAQELAQRLDCAALAMRYPVGDAFATDLMVALYKMLLEKGQSLPAALHLALTSALAQDGPHLALSSVTPLLFGPRAAALRLTPPTRPLGFKLPQVGLGIAFPPEPPRFVGRVQPLLRASQALARKAEQRGILFYGLPGAGKTACALELTYRHERERFQAQIWYQAPEVTGEQRPDIGQELFNLMFEIERQLNAPQLGLTAALDDAQQWRSYTLPRLRAMLSQYSLLLVLDNLESLLTGSNGWRDPRWEELLDALLDHQGPSRVVLTSRHLPRSLADHPRLQRESIHALSFAESVLLARELPHLRQLFGAEAGLALLRRTLRLAQGHPKLLELADGLAADRSALAAQLDGAEQAAAADQAALAHFFEARPGDAEEGETRQGEDHFIRALGQWTRGISQQLDPTARLLFAFLCRLEAEDRTAAIIEPVWPNFLKRLGDDHPPAAAALSLPDHGLPPALDALEEAGLIEVDRPAPAASAPPDTDQLLALLTDQLGDQFTQLDPAHQQQLINQLASAFVPLPSSFLIHPGVAESTRSTTEAAILTAVDEELGNYWIAVYQHGRRTEMEGGGRLVAQSGRRAAPYLLRRERWHDAGLLLERMIQRDSSPATLALAIPLLRRIIEASDRIQTKGILATALLKAGRTAEAEQTLRDGIAECVAQENYRLASSYTGYLLDLLRANGRFAEALTLADEMADYSRRAGLGPWTQLLDEAVRLQVLNAMGNYDEVLARVEALRSQLDSLPEQSAQPETANPWNVREALLDTGRSAAMRSGQWEAALALNADILRYQEARGADSLELARTRYNDYGPLLRLGRYNEARDLLQGCRTVYERERAIPQLGKVYSALADLEYQVGDGETAVAFQQTALRYTYQAGNPEDCASSHHNLANYLQRRQADPALVLAHRLAAALIWVSIQSGHARVVLDNLAKSDPPAAPPTFDTIAAQVEEIPGVQFRALFARLPQRYPSGDAAIAAVWQLVQQEKAKQKEWLAGVIDHFEPLLQEIATVAKGNDGNHETIEQRLVQLQENNWHLTKAVQRIWQGERDAATLTADLDTQDSALIHRLLDILT